VPTPPENRDSEQRLWIECQRLREYDAVLKDMLDTGIPLTREHYIELAYAGDPPDPWTAENEEELPEPFRRDAG